MEPEGSFDEPGQLQAAPGSGLASLRERREKAKQRLTLDLPVPRLDPPVFVRFAPVPLSRINAAQKATEKSRDPDKDVKSNADVMAWACRGVFEVVDGVEVSIDPDDRHGEWPLFDARLAGLLGLSSSRASDVVRGLYLTDGDVVSTATKVAEWSGYAAEQEEREGN